MPYLLQKLSKQRDEEKKQNLTEESMKSSWESHKSSSSTSKSYKTAKSRCHKEEDVEILRSVIDPYRLAMYLHLIRLAGEITQYNK